MVIKNAKFLESEIRKLEKSTCNHNNKELGITWIPKPNAKKEGEVIGNTITSIHKLSYGTRNSETRIF
ncbi:hypothetical protein [Candidatus Nitrosotalea okcheonensis]|uniref:Uncharacterized protein n=1 Tax=Candidatus Nitrosotalea okcheonensis TaxID=1903276 RepID=A0A2H1FHM8_9ARCH|nr:hypothetical protein [Candidatus Nitrosotalea okcheonensis]SMH72263.1 protein of unknown function [Candidatus Nitrosotalea okcheonensis]